MKKDKKRESGQLLLNDYLIDIIDKDDIEFSIGYSNQIELERAGILTDDINDELYEIFMPLCSKGTDDEKYLFKYKEVIN